MLRKWDSDGWALVTHPDHAALAGDFASRWGNDLFPSPEPRKEVLESIYSHDDGWKERDRLPQITRQGLPSAFSIELVGKYSAFEEIDLADYLAVRQKALEIIAQRNPYAAVIISMHTHNLLSERADRSTIRESDLAILDAFLSEQMAIQEKLRLQLRRKPFYTAAQVSDETFLRHFHLLQACDCLSLLSCVDYDQPSDLLHELPTLKGSSIKIKFVRKDANVYGLDPFPFAGAVQKFTIPYRLVNQHTFTSSAELSNLYTAGPVKLRELTYIAI